MTDYRCTFTDDNGARCLEAAGHGGPGHRLPALSPGEWSRTVAFDPLANAQTALAIFKEGGLDSRHLVTGARDQLVFMAVQWHAHKASGDDLIRAVDRYLEAMRSWSEAQGGDEGEETPADAFGAATGGVGWAGEVFGDAKVIPLRGDETSR